MGKADYALMAEYHRGYEDGRAARAADEWALHHKRVQAMNRIDEYINNGYKLDDSPFLLPTLPGVIHALLDTDTYCLDDLVTGLKELLGADEDVRKPFVEYDVLGNERHKAICELRKLADCIDDGQWVGMYDLGDALGFDLYRTHHNPIRKILQLFVGDEYDDQYYEPKPLSGNSAECCILDEFDENDEIVNSENLRRDTTDVGCDDLLDLIRDAAMDYRSLKQADELRTRVLDAAIEENKSLRKKLMERDTAEHIVRDLTLGKITESDAIRRIEKLGEIE